MKKVLKNGSRVFVIFAYGTNKFITTCMNYIVRLFLLFYLGALSISK